MQNKDKNKDTWCELHEKIAKGQKNKCLFWIILNGDTPIFFYNFNSFFMCYWLTFSDFLHGQPFWKCSAFCSNSCIFACPKNHIREFYFLNFFSLCQPPLINQQLWGILNSYIFFFPSKFAICWRINWNFMLLLKIIVCCF